MAVSQTLRTDERNSGERSQFENAMYMIFDSRKPVSKSCQRFVDWAKKNVRGVRQ